MLDTFHGMYVQLCRLFPWEEVKGLGLLPWVQVYASPVKPPRACHLSSGLPMCLTYLVGRLMESPMGSSMFLVAKRDVLQRASMPWKPL